MTRPMRLEHLFVRPRLVCTRTEEVQPGGHVARLRPPDQQSVDVVQPKEKPRRDQQHESVPDLTARQRTQVIEDHPSDSLAWAARHAGRALLEAAARSAQTAERETCEVVRSHVHRKEKRHVDENNPARPEDTVYFRDAV